MKTEHITKRDRLFHIRSGLEVAERHILDALAQDDLFIANSARRQTLMSLLEVISNEIKILTTEILSFSSARDSCLASRDSTSPEVKSNA